MESIIKKHNAKIINQKEDGLERMCNCRVKDKCPLKGHCLKKYIVYKANVSEGSELRYYFGLSEGEFKTCFNNQTLTKDQS